MIRLALGHAEGRPARKRDIAEPEGISEDYVAQILMELKRAGLVQSRRGAKGGFLLARDPGSITVADVLRATEGPFALVACSADGCERGTSCVARGLWERASRSVEEVFEAETIGAMAVKAKAMQEAGGLSFVI